VSCLPFTTPLRPQAAVERVPDFSLPDTSGHTVALRQFQGKVILLDFWATWCSPCKKEMPGYEGLYRRYKSRGLAVVGIALDSSPAKVRRFAKKYRITYPLLINGINVDRYGVREYQQQFWRTAKGSSERRWSATKKGRSSRMQSNNY